MIVFVSGGEGSGKSRLAESLALQTGKHCHHLATMGGDSAEPRRDQSGVALDAPTALANEVAAIAPGQTVLVECLTCWARQWLLHQTPHDEPSGAEWEGERQLRKLVHEARARRWHLIIVSSDLNEAPLSSDAAAWRFVTFVQRLHRYLAQEADSVIEVVAGCGIEWKKTDHWPERAAVTR